HPAGHGQAGRPGQSGQEMSLMPGRADRIFISGASSGIGAYCASKAAVHGYIDTPMTRNNRFPMPFLMPAGRFAAQAANVIARGATFRVLPWQMGVVARLLRLLPNALFDLAFSRAPTKRRQEEA